MSAFVVIEGLDGAGTTTQSTLLTEALQNDGSRAVLTREPSDGPIGTLIRQMLSRRVVAPVDGVDEAINRESLALLFAADRLDHLHVTIEPSLRDGAFVISDRYYASSLAYQGDVDESDAFDFEWVRTLNSRARQPDLTIFLEADVDLCLSRMASRRSRDIYESRAKLERLARRYDQVMATLGEAGEHIVRLDASEDIAGLHRAILSETLSL